MGNLGYNVSKLRHAVNQRSNWLAAYTVRCHVKFSPPQCGLFLFPKLLWVQSCGICLGRTVCILNCVVRRYAKRINVAYSAINRLWRMRVESGHTRLTGRVQNTDTCQLCFGLLNTDATHHHHHHHLFAQSSSNSHVQQCSGAGQQGPRKDTDNSFSLNVSRLKLQCESTSAVGSDDWLPRNDQEISNVQ